jgi:hypothetical protein
MAYVTSVFPPNAYLLKYIGSFLLGYSKSSSFAVYSLRRLEKTVYRGERGLGRHEFLAASNIFSSKLGRTCGNSKSITASRVGGFYGRLLAVP